LVSGQALHIAVHHGLTHGDFPHGDCWADATRKAESVEDARLILVSALEGMDRAGFYFELARYECQFGEIEGARDCLKRCLDPGWGMKALENPELEAVWGEG